MYNTVPMKNFNLHELISPKVMDLLGANAWSLFNKDFLHDVDKFVTDLKEATNCTAVIINNWKWNGGFTQSGFREFDSITGTPKSQHKQGNAVDLKFKGISIDEALEYLIANQHRYPNIKRYEDLSYTRANNEFGGWLHVDGKLDEPKLRGFTP